VDLDGTILTVQGDVASTGPTQGRLVLAQRWPAQAPAPAPARQPVAQLSAQAVSGAGAVLRRFWPSTHGLRRWLVLTAILLAILPVVQAGEIWLFKVLVDEVLVPGQLNLLPVVAVGFVALSLVSGALSGGDAWLSAWTGGHVALRVRGATFAHLLRLSPFQLRRWPVGDVLTRLSGDVAAIQRILVAGPASAIEIAARLIVFGGIVVWLDPVLAGVVFVTAPGVWLITRSFSHRVRRTARAERRQQGRLQARAEEALTAHPQVVAVAAEPVELQRYQEAGEEALAAELATTRLRALFEPLIDLLELLAALGVICVGAWSVAAGRLTVGELLAFLAYVTQLYGPLRDLAGLAVSAHAAAAGGERVAEVLDERPATPNAGDAPACGHRVSGELAFRDVSFRYPGADRPALEGVTFDASPGTVTAIMGPSGSGKSTLAMLLLRWADPDAGRVLLDGHDVRHLPPAVVRSAISVLLQESYLFDGTIGDNIRYPAAPPGPADRPANLGRVLDDADVWKLVRDQADGLDHPVGPKGTSLSVGQRRRIALARTLLHERPILLLDEFSAGLDPGSVRRILTSVRRPGRTVLLITHDPLVAEVADQVVVLDSGRVRSRDWSLSSVGAAGV
jgi:ATP-binding cassette, subfamily B, bacterial